MGEPEREDAVEARLKECEGDALKLRAYLQGKQEEVLRDESKAGWLLKMSPIEIGAMLERTLWLIRTLRETREENANLTKANNAMREKWGQLEAYRRRIKVLMRNGRQRGVSTWVGYMLSRTVASQFCWYCGELLGRKNDTSRGSARRTTDHVTPRRNGGSNKSTNLVPACVGCNNRKGGLGLEGFRETEGVEFFWGEVHNPKPVKGVKRPPIGWVPPDSEE